MEERHCLDVPDWLDESPDYEELVEYVACGMLEAGPLPEDVLHAVAKEAGDAVLTLVMLSMAAKGLISCRLGDHGELLWFASERAEKSNSEKFHQALETL